MCVLIIDTDGRVSVASWGAETFTGTTRATGRAFLDFVAPEFTRLCHDALIATRAGSIRTVHFRTHDRPDHWQATLAPLAFDSAEPVVAAFIRSVPDASLQKDQLIARGVRSVAHDLNNVLTVIVGLNGLMASGDDERRELYTAEIGKAADRATGLAAELLAFGRKPGQEVRVFGMNALLLELQPMLRRLLPHSFNLAVHVSDRIDPIRVDRAVVEGMIIDLLVSLVQTMADGGQLDLRTYSQLITREHAATHVIEDGKYTVWETLAAGKDADAVAVPAAIHAAAIDAGAFVTADTAAGTATVRVFFRAADHPDSRVPLA